MGKWKSVYGEMKMLGGKMKKSHIQIFYNEYSETPIKPTKLKNDENNSENNSKLSYTLWVMFGEVWGGWK